MKKFWIPFWAIFATCAAAILLAADWLEATGLINRDPTDLASMVLFVGLLLCVPLVLLVSIFAAVEAHQLWRP